MQELFSNMSETREGVFAAERLTHEEAGRRIALRPAIIVPLGGCEPFGGAGELGTESECVLAVAREVSARCRILAAPLIPFGCSTPFMAFAGAAGVKPRTFVNMLCEILRAYVFQGVEAIFLVSATPFNREPAGEALRRVGAKYPAVRAELFDINTVLRGDGGGDFDRDDALMLSIRAYLRQRAAGEAGGGAAGDETMVGAGAKPVGKEQYRAWKRRGRDPQKFRSLCPGGLLLPPDGGEISAGRGRECFEMIVNIIQEKIGAAPV